MQCEGRIGDAMRGDTRRDKAMRCVARREKLSRYDAREDGEKRRDEVGEAVRCDAMRCEEKADKANGATVLFPYAFSVLAYVPLHIRLILIGSFVLNCVIKEE